MRDGMLFLVISLFVSLILSSKIVTHLFLDFRVFVQKRFKYWMMIFWSHLDCFVVNIMYRSRRRRRRRSLQVCIMLN